MRKVTGLTLGSREDVPHSPPKARTPCAGKRQLLQRQVEGGDAFNEGGSHQRGQEGKTRAEAWALPF